MYSIVMQIVETTETKEVIRDRTTGDSETPTGDLAPKGRQYAYNFIEHIGHLHACMFLPFHRITAFLQNGYKSFPKSQLYSLFHFQATCLIGLYLYLYEVLSAEAEIIQIDDTTARVIAAQKITEKPENNDETNEKKIDLDAEVCDILGPPKYNKKNKLKQLKTTCVTGKIHDKGRVILYRTHHGHAGDLLEEMLTRFRGAESDNEEKLYVVGDMSADNNPSPETAKKYGVTRVGCMAHARRDVFLHREKNDLLY